MAEGTSQIQTPQLNGSTLCTIFISFSPTLNRRQLQLHSSRQSALILFWELVIGFQSQYVSVCLSPSVTGQDFSGIEGSATHPGSSLRHSPSFVGEGRTTETRNSRFYKDYATPSRLIPLFLHYFGVSLLSHIFVSIFRAFSRFYPRIFLAFYRVLVATAMWKGGLLVQTE